MRAHQRHGFALVGALFAIVVIGLLAAGALFAANQERRMGRGVYRGEEALAGAETGAARMIERWDPRWNLRLANGEHLDRTDTVGGAVVATRATRLGKGLIWIVAEARAGQGFERQRIALLARLEAPEPRLLAALTAGGRVMIDPDSRIDGVGGPADTACSSLAPGPAGVAVHDSSSVVGAVLVSGSPPVLLDSAAAIVSRAPFGAETYETLAARADILLPAGASASPRPAGECPPLPDDWGDPRAPVSGGCGARVPLVHAAGDLTLRGPARGQGLVLVDGALLVDGPVDLHGLIVARGGLTLRRGARITGAVISDTDARLESGAELVASRCAVARAVSGAARPRRLASRGWVQLH